MAYCRKTRTIAKNTSPCAAAKNRESAKNMIYRRQKNHATHDFTTNVFKPNMQGDTWKYNGAMSGIARVDSMLLAWYFICPVLKHWRYLDQMAIRGKEICGVWHFTHTLRCFLKEGTVSDVCWYFGDQRWTIFVSLMCLWFYFTCI